VVALINETDAVVGNAPVMVCGAKLVGRWMSRAIAEYIAVRGYCQSAAPWSAALHAVVRGTGCRRV